MSLESSLFAYLSANTAVKAIVASRIFPNVAADKAALPYIVYRRIGSTPTMHLDAESGLVTARVQVNCLATTHANAIALASAVRLALKDYRGAMGATTIQACNFINEADLDTVGAEDALRRTYGRFIDLEFWYEE